MRENVSRREPRGSRPAAPDTPDELFQAFPVLGAMPEKARKLLLSRAVRRSLHHKELLVRGGRECAYLPLVLSGSLRVYKSSESGRELTLFRIERGESCVLSATCILQGGPFPAQAEAEGETELLLVPADLLLRLVDEEPAWRRYVLGLYSARLQTALALVEEVAFRHVDERLAAYLLAATRGRGVTVSRTHGEIALELGTSREVVSRILKDFESDGLIATLRGRIRILEADELGKRARVV